MKDLPIYDITIEDDAEIQGVSKISLVDVPAIGVNWIALRKVELPKTMMAIRKKKPKMAFVKKECLGCPPNGDGTRVNGEPDKRCKGDGSGKTAKGGGKASAKPSEKSPEKIEPVKSLDVSAVPTSVLSLAPADKWSDEQKAYWNDEKNVQAVIAKNQELENRRFALDEKVSSYRGEPELRDEIRKEREAIAREEQAMYRINSVAEEAGVNPYEGTIKGDEIAQKQEKIRQQKEEENKKLAQREAQRQKEIAEKEEKARAKEERDLKVNRAVVIEIQDEIRANGFADFSNDEYQNLVDFTNTVRPERSYSQRGQSETIVEKYPIRTNAKNTSNAGTYWRETPAESGKHIYASETVYKRNGMFSSSSFSSSIAKITEVGGKTRIEPTDYGKRSGEFNKLMDLWRNSKKSAR